MRQTPSLDDMTLEELERLLVVRRYQARRQRLRTAETALRRERTASPPHATTVAVEDEHVLSSWRDRFLLVAELVALIGLVAASFLFLWDWRQEQTASDRIIAAVAQSSDNAPREPDQNGDRPTVLPGRPTPPPAAERRAVPALYADFFEPPDHSSQAVVGNETDVSAAPARIKIPRINVDAPVVEGDDWEALKQGVGHHIGSANPGERGNMVLSGHNDIYGEIFRYLHELEPGDTFSVYDGAGRVYRYVVAVKRIVEPTAVEVLEQTSNPVATLITCYPYLIDTQRLIVVAELQP